MAGEEMIDTAEDLVTTTAEGVMIDTVEAVMIDTVEAVMTITAGDPGEMIVMAEEEVLCVLYVIGSMRPSVLCNP